MVTFSANFSFESVLTCLSLPSVAVHFGFKGASVVSDLAPSCHSPLAQAFSEHVPLLPQTLVESLTHSLNSKLLSMWPSRDVQLSLLLVSCSPHSLCFAI